MSFLLTALLFLHLVGAAALVGGWLATFKHPTVGQWQLYGAWLQLVTGLLMVGVAEMNDADVNNAWVGVKLVIALAVLVAAILGRRKIAQGHEVSTGLAHAVGGLSLINIAVAVFWQ